MNSDPGTTLPVGWRVASVVERVEVDRCHHRRERFGLGDVDGGAACRCGPSGRSPRARRPRRGPRRCSRCGSRAGTATSTVRPGEVADVGGVREVRAARTGAPVPGERDHHEARVDRRQIVERAAPVAHRLGAEVLDHDVGDGDEPPEERAPLLGVHLERDVSRAARQAAVHERVRDAGRLVHCGGRSEAVRRVPEHLRARERLDLHDVGSELGEEESGGVPGDERAEGEDTKLVDGAAAAPDRTGSRTRCGAEVDVRSALCSPRHGAPRRDGEQLGRRLEGRAGHADVTDRPHRAGSTK